MMLQNFRNVIKPFKGIDEKTVLRLVGSME